MVTSDSAEPGAARHGDAAMLAATRRRKILDMLDEQRGVRTEEVARQLGVSVETMRRDLMRLEDAGEAVRVHGGAVAIDLPGRMEPAFAAREALSAEAKRSIARAAVAMIGTARTIFVDLGTTATCLAREMPETLEATVVTSSLRVAEVLVGHGRVDVIVLGGAVRSGDLAVSGDSAVQFVRDIHPDIAFLGSGGFHLEHGLTDYVLADVAVKRIVLGNSQQTFALVDSTKFGATAPYRVCSATSLTGVITDSDAPDESSERLRAANVRVVHEHRGSSQAS